MLTAIETTGTINANHQIELDEELPNDSPSRVRVIVLFDENSSESKMKMPETEEKLWADFSLTQAMRGLKEEDVDAPEYTEDDLKEKWL